MQLDLAGNPELELLLGVGRAVGKRLVDGLEHRRRLTENRSGGMADQLAPGKLEQILGGRVCIADVALVSQQYDRGGQQLQARIRGGIRFDGGVLRLRKHRVPPKRCDDSSKFRARSAAPVNRVRAKAESCSSGEERPGFPPAAYRAQVAFVRARGKLGRYFSAASSLRSASMFFSCRLTACLNLARRLAYFWASFCSSGSGAAAPSPYAARASTSNFSSVSSSSVRTFRRSPSRPRCVSASTFGNPAGVGEALADRSPRASSPTPHDSFFQPFSGATLV